MTKTPPLGRQGRSTRPCAGAGRETRRRRLAGTGVSLAAFCLARRTTPIRRLRRNVTPGQADHGSVP